MQTKTNKEVKEQLCPKCKTKLIPSTVKGTLDALECKGCGRLYPKPK